MAQTKTTVPDADQGPLLAHMARLEGGYEQLNKRFDNLTQEIRSGFREVKDEFKTVNNDMRWLFSAVVLLLLLVAILANKL